MTQKFTDAKKRSVHTFFLPATSQQLRLNCLKQLIVGNLNSNYFFFLDAITVIEKGNIMATSLVSNLPTNGNRTAVANESTNLAHHITSDPTTDSEFVQLLLPVIEKIISLQANELHPNPTTNALFNSLVNLICVDKLKEDYIFRILSDSDILHYQQDLMQQCSSAEYFLEASFAREIQSGNKSIEDFIYYDNYVSLVQFEMDNLKIYAKNISITRAVVIGSGPLPLTSVEILKHVSPSAVVTNYDHSEEAVELATIVVSGNERTFVENRTALDINANDLRHVDLVYLAALVGTDKVEKKKIVDHLYTVMKSGSILIARSAIGLKTLLYRRIEDEELGKFSNIQEFHPKDKKVINSIICGTR